MRQGATLLLRGVVVLMATATIAAMIRFPQTEGRAANLDLVSIYADPLIIYGYLASIPFFVGLHQAFKILGYVDSDEIFSMRAVNAVRSIKYCALAMPVLITAAEAFIIINASDDDFAGPVALGIATSFVSIVIAAGAATVERLLRNTVEAKSNVV